MINFLMVQIDGERPYKTIKPAMDELDKVRIVAIQFCVYVKDTNILEAYNMKYTLGIPSDNDVASVFYALYEKPYKYTFKKSFDSDC